MINYNSCFVLHQAYCSGLLIQPSHGGVQQLQVYVYFLSTVHLHSKRLYPFRWMLQRALATYIQRGMRPLMEIGFMPKALSSHPEPYEHHWSTGGNIWTGWTCLPKDYNKWRELVYQCVKHSIDW